MIFKLIKIPFLLLLISAMGYFIMQRASQDHITNEVSDFSNLDNSSRKVLYTKQLKGGILKLTADKATLHAKTEIVLNNIDVIFRKQDNEVVIKSQDCKFNIKTKRIVLYNDVVIRSSDIECTTKEAVVDLGKLSIFGKSKIEGRQSNIKFTADGFSIDSKGVVKLKNAKFGKI